MLGTRFPLVRSLLAPAAQFAAVQSQFIKPAAFTQSALNNSRTRAVACFPGDCRWCELQD
jgi:hypothetical protein